MLVELENLEQEAAIKQSWLQLTTFQTGGTSPSNRVWEECLRVWVLRRGNLLLLNENQICVKSDGKASTCSAGALTGWVVCFQFTDWGWTFSFLVRFLCSVSVKNAERRRIIWWDNEWSIEENLQSICQESLGGENSDREGRAPNKKRWKSLNNTKLHHWKSFTAS